MTLPPSLWVVNRNPNCGFWLYQRVRDDQTEREKGSQRWRSQTGFWEEEDWRASFRVIHKRFMYLMLFIYLFLGKFQVTNQMISACKAHITNNGTATIWSQPQDMVMQKIAAAIKLKQVTVLGLSSVALFFFFVLHFWDHSKSFDNDTFLVAKQNSGYFLFTR